MHQIPSKRLCGIRFTNHSTEEITNLSVKQISNPQTFDSFLHPTYGGLYDPALGPSDRDDVCTTCFLTFLHCPGHFGHISLPLPVYNPLFFKLLVQILKGSCLHCHHLLADRGTVALIKAQLQCLEYGLLSAIDDLENIMRELTVDGCDDSVAEITEINRELQKYVEKALQGLDKAEASRNAHVRNITECRQSLVNAFKKNQIKHRARCGLCNKRVNALRAQHNSKIYVNKLSRRVAVRKAAFETKATQQDSQNKDAGENEGVNTLQEQNNVKEAAEVETDIDKVYVTPQDAREYMKKLLKNEDSLLHHLFGCLAADDNVERPKSIDVFFLEVLPVPPSRFRPISKMNDQQFENPQTANLSSILTDCVMLRQIVEIMKREEGAQTEVDGSAVQEIDTSVLARVPGESNVEKLHNSWVHLQSRVNCLVDSDLDKLNSDKHPGIRQILEKKDGLFRKHMMGKRVNYAARSVISPDPNIATDEIGIPEVIATRLTYPQAVTPWNVVELRQAVMNGPNIHPGALMLENPDGSKTMLNAGNKTQREAIAKQLLTPQISSGVSGPKKVHRHVKNGDVLLINRQPTLHKPSIMAHKARILRGEKTLRLHYANCKSYNADFDGDEMNVHLPQNEVARAEAYNIMTTTNQYLVPKDSTPLSGLIQDHMVSGVRLTMRGRFFNRKDYQHLVYSALTDKSGPVYLLPPAILKPCKLWSGKQVLSTVLLNVIPENKEPLNYKGRTKISGKNWQACKPRLYIAGGTPLEGDEMSESEVIVRHGELLCGVLDKAHYGPTPYGLVHCCYELYDGKVSGRLLTCLARLFTTFLQSIAGFTLGVEDILVKDKADKKRRKALKKAAVCGNDIAAKALRLEDATDTAILLEKLENAHRSRDGNDMKEIDLCMKSKTDEVTNTVNKICMPDGLHKKFPENCLQLMVQSGAKGSQVNCMQISCLLGQIELEGRRPPVMVSGRSLPSFLPYDTSPRAGGFVDGRFLTGIRPQEYFFHCMAGREGLVDTAVKTSRSGYLQRCLIKHLEGLVIGYDLTVRDSDSSIVQFQYGEDCLDILKTPFLREQQFPFMIANHSSILDDKHLEKITQKMDTQKAKEAKHKVQKWRKKNQDREGKKTLNPFIYFSNKKIDKVMSELREAETETEEKDLDLKVKNKLVEMWRNLGDKNKYAKHCTRCPDPALTQLQPDLYFGSTSENFTKMTESYITRNPQGLLCDKEDPSSTKLSGERFQTLMNMKYLTSLGEPGEAVGLLAAQSIGEPSTQMTLNTFHFAGRGEMNVTLGIPRLREILMVGSKNIKTPSMSIPVYPSHKATSRVKKLKKKLTKLYLSEVLENVHVCEIYETKRHAMKYRIYRIKLSFLPQEYYKDTANLTSSDVMYYVETRFMKRLASAIKQKMKQIADIRIMDSETRASVLNDDLAAVNDRLGNHRNMEVDAISDEDDEPDDEDGDAVARKRRNQRTDELEYEEGGEEEEESVEEGEESDAEEEDGQNEGEQDDDEVNEREEKADEVQVTRGNETLTPRNKKKTSTKKKKKTEKVVDSDRVDVVCNSSEWIVDYKYDDEEELWCEVSFQLDLFGSNMDMCSVVREESKKCVVHEIPGITRCFLTDSTIPGDAGSKVVQTEGVNIMEMFKYHKILNLQRLYSNDIHAMANTYGIEAARRVVIQEIKGVFKAYGIYVNSRHLTLVADYMTFDGSYRPFNRVSLESNSSPLQKMTFEQSMTYLKQATIDGAYDQLKSPSARLVVGRVVSGGTGAFDLVQPLV